jgi:GNAT superfamily N-acetyltransferase
MPWLHSRAWHLTVGLRWGADEQMTASVSVQQVDELPQALEPLIADSVREGFGFLERLREDWASGANRFDKAGEAFFVGQVARELAGVCGLNRDPYSGDPSIGRLRRLYVSPGLRRRGVARCLVARALSLAREHYAAVRIRTDNPSAALFYEALGFIPTTSPQATHELRVSGGDRLPTRRCS